MSSIWIAGKGPADTEFSIDFPRTERLVKGNPERHTYAAYEHPHMDCGIWECEVGAWNIVFSENKQEFFQVIQGIIRIHDSNTHEYIEIKAGEAGVIPPGFIGTFEVIQPVKKYYVNVIC